jgi:hypothetical protein
MTLVYTYVPDFTNYVAMVTRESGRRGVTLTVVEFLGNKGKNPVKKSGKIGGGHFTTMVRVNS